MSEKLSFMYVEKVVKPPQKPVVSNSLVAGDIMPFPFHDNPERKPMIRQPNILTAIVPKGKAMTAHDCTTLETKNLVPPPKKLPILTSNNSFIPYSIFTNFIIYLRVAKVQYFSHFAYTNV